MRILKILSHLLICICCIFCLSNFAYGADNLPYGDIGEYGDWITHDNMQKFNGNISGDLEKFEGNFQSTIKSNDFVPFEVRIGLKFMQALSAIDYVLQNSLVKFVIIFLLVMYIFWIGLEAYKLIRESNDYKKFMYDIFIKGIIISVWIGILFYGPAKIFTLLVSPILALSTAISDFILNTVAQVYNIDMPNTCAAIKQYVNENTVINVANNQTANVLMPDMMANIMCVPGRLSMFFYHAMGAGFKWMIHGFGQNTIAVITGAISIVIFFKCILKYAFMTLGVVADLFLRLLMLPFTALAESMPSTSEKGYLGQIFNGFLKLFNTQKVADILTVFINVAIYFVSLSIIIAICAALLSSIVLLNDAGEYSFDSAMVSLLAGCFVLYLAGKADELAQQVGGKIDNSFGVQIQNDTKTLWDKGKNFAGMVYKDWLKKR